MKGRKKAIFCSILMITASISSANENEEKLKSFLNESNKIGTEALSENNLIIEPIDLNKEDFKEDKKSPPKDKKGDFSYDSKSILNKVEKEFVKKNNFDDVTKKVDKLEEDFYSFKNEFLNSNLLDLSDVDLLTYKEFEEKHSSIKEDFLNHKEKTSEIIDKRNQKNKKEIDDFKKDIYSKVEEQSKNFERYVTIEDMEKFFNNKDNSDISELNREVEELKKQNQRLLKKIIELKDDDAQREIIEDFEGEVDEEKTLILDRNGNLRVID